MIDHRKHIDRLRRVVADVDERLAVYEAMARDARGPLSPSFADKLERLRAEHKHLAERISDERLAEALSWAEDDSGALRIADEIAGRIDELLTHVDTEAPKRTG